MLVNVPMDMKLRRMTFGSITRDGGKCCARAANSGSSSGMIAQVWVYCGGYACGVWGAEVWSMRDILDSCAKMAVVGTHTLMRLLPGAEAY